MRNPNGYGTVMKLSGARRRSYAARVTVGWVNGKQKTKCISYHASKAEAALALADFYRAHPNIAGRAAALEARDITMAELFGKWLKNPKNLAQGTIDNHVSAFKHCAALHDTPYASIKAYMMDACINGCAALSRKGTIKELFGHLDRFAYGLDIISKMYSKVIKVGKPPRQKDTAPFTDEEVARLWDNAGVPWVDTVLILLYSGWRIAELLGLRKADVDMEAGTMQGGVKTKASKKRLVPIHSRIRPLIENLMAAPGEYLINWREGKMNYYPYVLRYRQVMKLIGAKHTIHETRHTFRTWLDAAGANIASANKIMGHKCGDMGLDTYTHKTIDELKKTIELIK